MTAETNTERLTRIAATDRYMFDRAGRHVSIRFPDFDWLIQQAERSQELEYEILKYKKRFERQLYVFQENARLRKALEFYAEEENYETEISYLPQMAIDCMALGDGGFTARTALNTQEGTE